MDEGKTHGSLIMQSRDQSTALLVMQDYIHFGLIMQCYILLWHIVNYINMTKFNQAHIL